MDNDYIKREIVLNILCSECTSSCAKKCYEYMLIKTYPTADVKPVIHASWDADGRCSACGNRWNEYLHDDANDWGYFDPMPPFCNNCGAMMDEEK